MYAIERNDGENKGIHLISKIGNQIVVPIDNVKKLFGYSKKTQDKLILDKVSKDNIIYHTGNTLEGKHCIIEKYVTLDGLKEIASKITQHSKKQNAEIAIKMIEKHYGKSESNNEKSYKVTPIEIIGIMDKNGFSKNKWEALYEIFSKRNNIFNVHHEAYAITGKNLLKYTTLKFVFAKYPNLIQSLYEVAKEIS